MSDKTTKPIGIRFKQMTRYKAEVVATARGYSTFTDWVKSLVDKEIYLYEDKFGPIRYVPDKPSA